VVSGEVGAGRPVSGGSLLHVDAANVVVEAVKRSEDDPGEVVLRMYEAWGLRGPVTVYVPWEVRRASFTDLLEREVSEASVGSGAITFDVSPFEIVTLKLEPA
jgi:alpha-mannosidase